MTRKELEMKLLDMVADIYAVAREADPEIECISIYARNGQFNVSAYRDDSKTDMYDLFGTYRAYATRFVDGHTWTSEEWSEIYDKKEETV